MKKKLELVIKKDSGVLDGIIVSFGFFPIAVAFGVVAKEFGFTLIESSFYSLIVFAGASQFAAVGVLISGGSFINAIIITFLMNLRHFLMGMSLMVIHKDSLRRFKAILGFMLTDESYTFLSLTSKKMSESFALKFQLMTYISWNLGTIAGFILGSSLPYKVSQSLEIALYAMFASLASITVKKDKNNLLVIIISGIIHTILYLTKIFDPSCNLIISMIIGAILGSCIKKTFKSKEVLN